MQLQDMHLIACYTSNGVCFVSVVSIEVSYWNTRQPPASKQDLSPRLLDFPLLSYNPILCTNTFDYNRNAVSDSVYIGPSRKKFSSCQPITKD